MSASGKFVPVMLTPFKENGEVDYSTLTTLTEWYIEAGATGLFANCLSSEMFELSEEERVKVTRHVVEAANGAVPVVSTGTFGGSIASQAEFSQRIFDTGVEGVIAITGLLAAETDPDSVLDHNVGQLLGLTGEIPFGFYECPVPYKRVLTPKQLGDYAATGRVIYHKDTCLDLNQVNEKLEAVKGTRLELYDAYMVNAVASLKSGAGLSCIQGNYFPEFIAWICRNFSNPEKAHAVAKAQQFLVDIMDPIHNVYPITAKYFLQKSGFKINLTTRRDVGIFDEQTRLNIDKLYDQYQALKAEILD